MSPSDTVFLRDLADYVKETVNCRFCDIETYVSTDSMIVNKGGVVTSVSVPKTGSVNTYVDGDILLSNIRPYFKKIWKANRKGTCSTDVLVIRPKDHKLSEYLYCVLSDDNFFEYVMQGSKGTKMPRGDKEHIMDYPTPYKNEDEMTLIGDFISTIDKKIVVDSKINDYLLKAVNAIFDATLQDNDCNMVALSSISKNITDGVHSTVNDDENGDYYLLSCKNIKNGIVSFDSTDRRINKETFDKLRKRTQLSKGDLLLSSVGTIGELVILLSDPANYEFQRSVAIIKPDLDKISSEYLYCALNHIKADIINSAHGAVQQCLFINDVSSLMVPIVSYQKIVEFTNCVKPFFELMGINNKSNMYLSKERDIMLPKLMSGEINAV